MEIGDGLHVSGRIDRVDTSDGHGARDRLQERPQGRLLQGGELGVGEPLPGRALHAGRGEAARQARRGRRVRGAGMRGPASARHARGGRAGARLRVRGQRPSCRPRSSRRSSSGRASGSRDTAGAMRRGELSSTPDTCAWNGGCSYPSICRSEREPHPSSSRRWSAATARCWCGPGPARARRRCWWSASCGPWWTTALPVESMLAITFTDKAAAEMRERVRRPLPRARPA